MRGYKTKFTRWLHRQIKASSKRYKKSGLGSGRIKPTASEILFFCGFTGLVLFGTRIAIAQQQLSPPSIPTAVAAPAEQPAVTPQPEAQTYLAPSEPNRIVIPSINVDATVDPVGKLPDGSMETPGFLSGIVGWYEYSPTPGELGPSVMVGHVGNKHGKSVFWDLGKVPIGNEITVYREDGTQVVFVVTLVGQYGKDEFPTDAVYSDIDHAGLRLITCGGKYDYLTGKYPDNTVVFARMQIPAQ